MKGRQCLNQGNRHVPAPNYACVGCSSGFAFADNPLRIGIRFLKMLYMTEYLVHPKWVITHQQLIKALIHKDITCNACGSMQPLDLMQFHWPTQAWWTLVSRVTLLCQYLAFALPRQICKLAINKFREVNVPMCIFSSRIKANAGFRRLGQMASSLTRCFQYLRSNHLLRYICYGI